MRKEQRGKKRPAEEDGDSSSSDESTTGGGLGQPAKKRSRVAGCSSGESRTPMPPPPRRPTPRQQQSTSLGIPGHDLERLRYTIAANDGVDIVGSPDEDAAADSYEDAVYAYYSYGDGYFAYEDADFGNDETWNEVMAVEQSREARMTRWRVVEPGVIQMIIDGQDVTYSIMPPLLDPQDSSPSPPSPPW